MNNEMPCKVPNVSKLKGLIQQDTKSNGRLQSLSLPRDLSLGGTKPKKIYTQNFKDTNKNNSKSSDLSQKKLEHNYLPNSKRLGQDCLSKYKNKRTNHAKVREVILNTIRQLEQECAERNSDYNPTKANVKESGFNDKNVDTMRKQHLSPSSHPNFECDPVISLDCSETGTVEFSAEKQNQFPDKKQSNDDGNSTSSSIGLPGTSFNITVDEDCKAKNDDSKLKTEKIAL